MRSEGDGSLKLAAGDKNFDGRKCAGAWLIGAINDALARRMAKLPVTVTVDRRTMELEELRGVS